MCYHFDTLFFFLFWMEIIWKSIRVSFAAPFARAVIGRLRSWRNIWRQFHSSNFPLHVPVAKLENWKPAKWRLRLSRAHTRKQKTAATTFIDGFSDWTVCVKPQCSKTHQFHLQSISGYGWMGGYYYLCHIWNAKMRLPRLLCVPPTLAYTHNANTYE